MPAWIHVLIWNSLSSLADWLRAPSDWAQARIWETRDAINWTRGDVINWLYWFFNDVVPGFVPGREWVRDALINIVNWTFDQSTRILSLAIEWFWFHRDWGWNEWVWVARVLQFRQDLDTALDGLWRDLQAWVGAMWTGLRDWVGATIQGVRDWVGAMWTGLWDWVGAAIQGVRDWVGAMWSSVWDWVGARLQELRDWVGAQSQGLQDWVGATLGGELRPIRDWITNAQQLLDWVGDAAAELQAFRDDPAGYLWAKWEKALWPYVESWLIKVWDGVF